MCNCRRDMCDQVAAENDAGSIDAMNSQANELVNAQVLHSAGAKLRNVLRGHAVDVHGDQLIRLRMRISQVAQLVDELRETP